MKGPVSANDPTTGGLTQPGVLIFLVILLGAVIYLKQTRYMRRRPAYVTIVILLIALVVLGVQQYRAT